MRRAMSVDSWHVSRRMGVSNVSNSKSELQGHLQWFYLIGHISFPISVLLQLCLDFAPFLRYYHLFPKI